MNPQPEHALSLAKVRLVSACQLMGRILRVEGLSSGASGTRALRVQEIRRFSCGREVWGSSSPYQSADLFSTEELNRSQAL